MPIKKGNSKKGGFSLAPITLSEPVRATDGFTNLVETPTAKEDNVKPQQAAQGSEDAAPTKTKAKNETPPRQTVRSKAVRPVASEETRKQKADQQGAEKTGDSAPVLSLSERELLRILDADSIDEIYELTDVLRASSLKLYATLVRLADSRGRARVKNHELMSKAGIKGIATLYKQERWLMDLKLLEKKAKPGPHDGSSYVIHKLENLPLPAEIYEKFEEYLSGLK